MTCTLNNLIQKKKSSFLFALAFCLSFPLTGQKYKDFDKDHHIGLYHWEIPSKDPDRIILNFNGDPSTKRAVTWRTDLSVKNAKAPVKNTLHETLPRAYLTLNSRVSKPH